MTPLEQTLNGGYPGLFGEVVTEDVYRLRTLPFKPSLIVDVGANIGVFTRFAHELFPEAMIVAIEPDAENCRLFRLHQPPSDRIHLIQSALGTGGKSFRRPGAANGAMEVYLSTGLGYAPSYVMELARTQPATAQNATLFNLVKPFWFPARTIVKVDTEGAENCIWEDPQSFAVLQKSDYVCMELHYYGTDEKEVQKVRLITANALQKLDVTHYVQVRGPIMRALKRGMDYDISAIPA